MVQWCDNTLMIYGDEGDISQFVIDVAGAEEPFEFDRILPVPEILFCHRVGHKTFVIDGGEVEVDRWYCKKDDDHKVIEERPLSEEEKAEFDALEYDNFRDWAIEHWGCKSDTVDADVDNDGTSVICKFLTAGGPPKALVSYMRKHYPNFNIVAKFDYFEVGEAGYY